MTPAELAATALPDGNRIALTWPAGAGPVRIVRREGAYPEDPEPAADSQGVVVADRAFPDGRFVDHDLAAERTYYYRLFPYSIGAGHVRTYDRDPAFRVSATATGRYGFAEFMYRSLPGVYRRFDAEGRLRALLGIVGGQFDQFYSAVRAVPDLIDVTTVDGRLLPLLAHWIGWRLDNSLGLDRQRAGLRGAVQLYQATQTLAGLEAAARRVTGWPAAGKEFVQNVAMTNQPERLLLWLDPVDAPADPAAVAMPLSFDEATGGRIAVTTAGDRTRLYYATSRLGPDGIRAKDHTRAGWQPSTPVVARPGADRDPAAVRWAGTEWLFWAAWRPDGSRRIDYRRRPDGEDWSAIATFGTGTADAVARRSPAALVDDAGALWLFWRERAGVGWTVRYQRFTDPTATILSPAGAATLPPDASGADPRVESDLSVAFRPAGPRIWVLWSRRETLGPSHPEQRRWRVLSRFKAGTDVTDTSDWTPVVELPPVTSAPDHHDREPAPLVAADGSLTAYFSSTRDGSWSIWRAAMDPSTHTWGDPTAVTAPPYSDRAPVAFPLAGRLVVAYRSARPVRYDGRRFPGTVSADQRYCGSITPRTADRTTFGRLDDVATYTYDAGPPAGRTDADLIARDTVGLYLDPAGADPDTVADGQRRLDAVLPEFRPATARVVLIPRTRTDE